ncbi:hypothetical protein ACWCPE_23410 [Streptomyces nondiastaticus]|uniref:Uncharacterized protein n=1 Tax=Streptomyces nondiastaticus TaxID=3154512 RepID=A0ABW6U3B0_9ACTN
MTASTSTSSIPLEHQRFQNSASVGMTSTITAHRRPQQWTRGT